ncbi:riboflavin synthase [Chloroflexota bacterium]
MFTGIIEELGKVTSIKSGELTIIASNILQKMKLGESIAVNGTCLTVTSFDKKSFSVDVMKETLERTNLGSLTVGDKVNLESPLALGASVGGHLVQGHVDATGKVTSTSWDGEAMLVRFEAPPEVLYYIVEKGFITIDGISLTVVSRNNTSFQVSVVNYTRQHTTLDDRKIGSSVNLEVDIIAKYIEQFSQNRNSGITTDFLKEHGFLVK